MDDDQAVVPDEKTNSINAEKSKSTVAKNSLAAQINQIDSINLLPLSMLRRKYEYLHEDNKNLNRENRINLDQIRQLKMDLNREKQRFSDVLRENVMLKSQVKKYEQKCKTIKSDYYRLRQDVYKIKDLQEANDDDITRIVHLNDLSNSVREKIAQKSQNVNNQDSRKHAQNFQQQNQNLPVDPQVKFSEIQTAIMKKQYGQSNTDPNIMSNVSNAQNVRLNSLSTAKLDQKMIKDKFFGRSNQNSSLGTINENRELSKFFSKFSDKEIANANTAVDQHRNLNHNQNQNLSAKEETLINHLRSLEIQNLQQKILKGQNNTSNLANDIITSATVSEVKSRQPSGFSNNSLQFPNSIQEANSNIQNLSNTNETIKLISHELKVP